MCSKLEDYPSNSKKHTKLKKLHSTQIIHRKRRDRKGSRPVFSTSETRPDKPSNESLNPETSENEDSPTILSTSDSLKHQSAIHPAVGLIPWSSAPSLPIRRGLHKSQAFVSTDGPILKISNLPLREPPKIVTSMFTKTPWLDVRNPTLMSLHHFLCLLARPDVPIEVIQLFSITFPLFLNLSFEQLLQKLIDSALTQSSQTSSSKRLLDLLFDQPRFFLPYPNSEQLIQASPNFLPPRRLKSFLVLLSQLRSSKPLSSSSVVASISLKCSPAEVAAYLTWHESVLLSQMSPFDLLTISTFSSPSDIYPASASAYIQWFKDISNWMIYSVLSVRQTSARAAHIDSLIQLGLHFRHLNNFNGVAQVLTALHTSYIQTLLPSWRLVQPNNLEIFRVLSNMLAPISNFQAYRQALANSTIAIPFIGLLFRDLTLCRRNCPTFVGEISSSPSDISQIDTFLHFDASAISYPDLHSDVLLNTIKLSGISLTIQYFLTISKGCQFLSAQPPAVKLPKSTTPLDIPTTDQLTWLHHHSLKSLGGSPGSNPSHFPPHFSFYNVPLIHGLEYHISTDLGMILSDYTYLLEKGTPCVFRKHSNVITSQQTNIYFYFVKAGSARFVKGIAPHSLSTPIVKGDWFGLNSSFSGFSAYDVEVVSDELHVIRFEATQLEAYLSSHFDPRLACRFWRTVSIVENNYFFYLVSRIRALRNHSVTFMIDQSPVRPPTFLPLAVAEHWSKSKSQSLSIDGLLAAFDAYSEPVHDPTTKPNPLYFQG